MPSNPFSKGLRRNNALLGLNLQLNPAEPLFLYQTRMRNRVNPPRDPHSGSHGNKEGAVENQLHGAPSIGGVQDL